jgi:DNA-binding winged helix-turn-helix (wHTH) protein
LTYRSPRETLSPETKPTEALSDEVLERGFSVTIKNSAVFAGARQTSMVRVPARTDTLQATEEFGIQLTPHERITELDLDHFQVALVPRQGPEGNTGKSLTRTGGARRLLVLPMTWKQLLEQVRKEIDRARATVKEGLVRFGNVTVDLLSMEVRRSERPVNLTSMEFKVLKYLVLNPNRVISRDDFLDHVWGYENYPCTRTVDNHILKLRHKLEAELANPVHFRTVHGTGYKFTP